MCITEKFSTVFWGKIPSQNMFKRLYSQVIHILPTNVSNHRICAVRQNQRENFIRKLQKNVEKPTVILTGDTMA
jgi:transcriptional regulator of NAD metabolism